MRLIFIFFYRKAFVVCLRVLLVFFFFLRVCIWEKIKREEKDLVDLKKKKGAKTFKIFHPHKNTRMYEGHIREAMLEFDGESGKQFFQIIYQWSNHSKTYIYRYRYIYKTTKEKLERTERCNKNTNRKKIANHSFCKIIKLPSPRSPAKWLLVQTK